MRASRERVQPMSHSPEKSGETPIHAASWVGLAPDEAPGDDPKISGRSLCLEVPVIFSTSNTRSIGTRVHCDTAPRLSPRARDSATTPPILFAISLIESLLTPGV